MNMAGPSSNPKRTEEGTRHTSSHVHVPTIWNLTYIEHMYIYIYMHIYENTSTCTYTSTSTPALLYLLILYSTLVYYSLLYSTLLLLILRLYSTLLNIHIFTALL